MSLDITKNITVSYSFLNMAFSLDFFLRYWKSEKLVEHDHHTDGLVIILMIVTLFLYFVALAVYVRSPAAYKALQSFGILNLPSKSTMQAYTGAFMHDPGASNVCIAEQVVRYVVFKEECCKSGKQEPKSDGVLIFDKVKVACQIMWNSRNHQLMGLAMTSNDLSSLNDIYKILQNPGANIQTSYVLQFLWRDLTSSYDIVGPYFTSSTSVENKFVMACIFETIKLFQYHDLKTSLLVCDGGSANISVIKASHGCQGTYSLKEDAEDKFEVEPWIINPFNPPNLIFWLICPSHQVRTFNVCLMVFILCMYLFCSLKT